MSSFFRSWKKTVSKSTQTENGVYLSRLSIISGEQNSTNSSSVQHIRRPQKLLCISVNSVLQPQDGGPAVRRPDCIDAFGTDGIRKMCLDREPGIASVFEMIETLSIGKDHKRPHSI